MRLRRLCCVTTAALPSDETVAQRPRSLRNLNDQATDFDGARALHSRVYSCPNRYSLISSTVFFTELKDLSNMAFSSAVSSMTWIFSTPLLPIVTGTPM